MDDDDEEYEVGAIVRQRTRESGISIRCCGKIIPSPKLAGSLNRTPQCSSDLGEVPIPHCH